ncbi:inorganic phosphate transporter, partial [Campylobacter concisus]|uniref:inorganic phosphate transporter n=1 Tax=Campylobacter concisus TaxID=199 RepID=UPI0015E19BBF
LNPMKFVIIMISALLSSGLWLLYASKKGLPVSTTHSIVGGIVGAGLAMGFMINEPEPMNIVSWGEIGRIAVSWVISPLLGGVMSYIIFGYVKSKIIEPTHELKTNLKALKAERKVYKGSFIKALKTKPAEEQIATISKIAVIDEVEIETTES